MTADLTGIGTPGLWVGFLVFVLAMLAVDLGLFHRRPHAVTFREALGWSVVWVALSLGFGGLVHWWFGPTVALEYYTGWFLEKALAVDNLFVFVAVFGALSVPAASQHRVLFWGVLGALVMRGGFILVGSALLEQFEWLLYVFGLLLVATGIKLLVRGDDADAPVEDNRMLAFLRRVVPSTGYRGESFLVKEAGKWLATPLLFALVLIEVADLVFAVDSIPAIFAVTRDPFVVFTSNVFAILGLRSMYFLLADLVPRFVYLKAGLALVLVFVGGKMVLIDLFHVPVAVSLGVVASLVGASIAASLWATRPVPAPQR